VAYTPYIGFVFVGENFRGNRISEKLCKSAMDYAKSLGFDNVYLVSGEVNLYEKYGFIKIEEKLSNWGAVQSIFVNA
jgi:predicted GNAT family N-acyltransferase